MVRNKGGLSAIVATVLIVLITVAAVAIFWVAILPVIQENILFVGEEARLSIIVDKGYTAFDADKRIASVQVKRGSDDANLSRLNIIFEVDGSSVIFKTTSAPAVNEMKTYWINFTKEGILGDPSSVSVAPVYLRNGQEVLGEVAGKVEIPLRSITLSPAELADIFADSGNVLKRVDEPGDGGEGCDPACGSGDECIDGDCVPVIYIDSCDTSGNIVINQSDTTFRLTGNVESDETCFTIGYDGVTLDFAGFSITGDDTGEDYGVYVNGYDNVTIKNGEIYDFGEVGYVYNGAGIYLANNQNNNITNMTVNSNLYGIYLRSSSNNTITNITANSNTYYGIHLRSSSNNTLTNITANSNYYGIFLRSSSSNNLTDITANSNTYRGIYLYSGSNNNILTNITANLNSDIGVYLYSSSNNNLTDITANSNTYNGIYLDSGSNNNLTDITANENGWNGVYLDSSHNNILTNITANSNDENGIYLSSGSYSNTFDTVTAYYNDQGNNGNRAGIYMASGCDYNVFNNIDASENTQNNDYGIYVDSGTYNNFTNIIANSNYYGIYLYSGSNNNILTNITANLNDYGIWTKGSSNNILTNLIANSNNKSGFLIQSSSNNNITNLITNSNNYGVVLQLSSNNNITNLITNLNEDYGVVLQLSSNNILTNLTSNLNEEGGIYFQSMFYSQSSSDNNILKDSNISGNKGYGVQLYLSSNNTLTNVYSCGNSYFDFFCSSSDAVGTGNTFKKSKIEFCEDGWPVLNTDYSECS